MQDSYRTIKGPAEGLFKDRGSKFFAYTFPVFSEEEIQDQLTAVRKMHPKARHHCYAWRLGLDGQQYRANDDGEPSGTAGRPMLGQIDSFGLTNVLAVVVRYFGGTLLGTSGLIQAYRESTADAFRNATIEDRILEAVFELEFHYGLMSPVMQAVKKAELEMVNQDFAAVPKLQIAIRLSETEKTLHRLKAAIAGVRPAEIDPEEKVEGLEIKQLFIR